MTAELFGWRKSSYSAAEGNCVEVGWRKSSYSGEETSCVEVGVAPEAVGVRDTKDRDGGTLVFRPSGWTHFVAALKENRFSAR